MLREHPRAQAPPWLWLCPSAPSALAVQVRHRLQPRDRGVAQWEMYAQHAQGPGSPPQHHGGHKRLDSRGKQRLRRAGAASCQIAALLDHFQMRSLGTAHQREGLGIAPGKRPRISWLSESIASNGSPLSPQVLHLSAQCPQSTFPESRALMAGPLYSQQDSCLESGLRGAGRLSAGGSPRPWRPQSRATGLSRSSGALSKA